MLAGICPTPESPAGSASTASASASAAAQDEGDRGCRGGGTKSGGAEGKGVGAVQGPLQLSSTAKAWKEGLGHVDVGKWDLIYRQAPLQCLISPSMCSTTKNTLIYCVILHTLFTLLILLSYLHSHSICYIS